jgi:antitoxin HigA-1
MTTPRHPGEFVREVAASAGVSHAEAARQLGVSRSALVRVMGGYASISPDLARRLEAWLANRRDWRDSGIARAVRASDLIRAQGDYDLAQTPPAEDVAPVKRRD